MCLLRWKLTSRVEWSPSLGIETSDTEGKHDSNRLQSFHFNMCAQKRKICERKPLTNIPHFPVSQTHQTSLNKYQIEPTLTLSF